MIKDYAIRIRNGRAYLKGEKYYGKKLHKIYGYRETYQTAAGEFSLEEWRKRVRQEIEAEGELDLLDRIREHCRTHCLWLKKAEELEDYAMDCLASEAFKYWKDFEETDSQDFIWM